MHANFASFCSPFLFDVRCFHLIIDFFIFVQDVLEEYAERVKRRGAVLKIDRNCLRWTPFVPPAPSATAS